jgi:hypothetical protein
MLTLNGLIHKATSGIGKHLESWRRYQHLWKQDKATSLDKFAAKNPTCVEFEEKLSKYSRVRRGTASAARTPCVWRNVLQIRLAERSNEFWIILKLQRAIFRRELMKHITLFIGGGFCQVVSCRNWLQT